MKIALVFTEVISLALLTFLTVILFAVAVFTDGGTNLRIVYWCGAIGLLLYSIGTAVILLSPNRPGNLKWQIHLWCWWSSLLFMGGTALLILGRISGLLM